jgi:hypothetical protein
MASLEMVQVPRLRGQLAEAYVLARRGLASIFLGVPEDLVSDAIAHTVGSFLLALIPGVMAQWSLDPEAAPSASDIAAGLRRVIEVVVTSK